MDQSQTRTILTTELSKALDLPITVVCMRLAHEKRKPIGQVRKNTLIDEEWDFDSLPMDWQTKLLGKRIGRSYLLRKWLQTNRKLNMSQLSALLGVKRQYIDMYVRLGRPSSLIEKWFLENGCPTSLLPNPKTKRDKRILGWIYLNNFRLSDVARELGVKTERVSVYMEQTEIPNKKFIGWLLKNGCQRDLIKDFYGVSHLPEDTQSGQ